jgi:four helix bundle protein
MNPVDPKFSAHAAGTAPKAAAPIRLRRVLVVAIVIILIGLAAGLIPRWFTRRALAQETQELAVTTVAVVSPSPGKSDFGVPLPAEVQPFVEAPIYARASGYLKHWLVDIGAAVTNGQLLAEIETPELDQQLAQAKAEVAQNQAALDLAKITSARWTELLKSASVSEQETAEKHSDLELKKANLDAALANLHRLEELKTFASVTAPFDGTITSRKTDVGQLITAGSGNELFRLAQAVAAQAREAARARSDDEFVSKLGGALQEADESALWLELLREECGMDATLTQPLAAEASELMAIFTTMINKTKDKNRK